MERSRRRIRRDFGRRHDVRTRRPHRYRVAAMSAGVVSPPDLILADERGNTWLMMPAESRLAPLPPAERDAIGLFYESVFDASWHTLVDLRRRFSDA